VVSLKALRGWLALHRFLRRRLLARAIVAHGSTPSLLELALRRPVLVVRICRVVLTTRRLLLLLLRWLLLAIRRLLQGRFLIVRGFRNHASATHIGIAVRGWAVSTCWSRTSPCACSISRDRRIIPGRGA
jgi:hypothetical protein